MRKLEGAGEEREREIVSYFQMEHVALILGLFAIRGNFACVARAKETWGKKRGKRCSHEQQFMQQHKDALLLSMEAQFSYIAIS